MPAKQTVLRMTNISKSFSGIKALEQVNLAVQKGEVHAICGENGAGKSTLMNVLSGVYQYGTYDGDIYFEGKICTFKSVRDSENMGIVIIHQELALSPFLSVAENIFLGNEITRNGVIDWETTNRKAKELLERVGLRVDPQLQVADLGVGQQQLLEIAKALSKEVKLLILDEPTAALNDEDSAHLLGLMRSLRRDGVAMILISHKLNEVEAVADRITVLRDGKTVGETSAVKQGEGFQNEIIRLMVGRSLESRFPSRTSNPGEDGYQITEWTVHHPIDRERKVVDSASLTLNRGEIVGLAGLMGAGRTELGMSLFGHQYGVDVSGEVFRDGEVVDTTTVEKAIRAGLAYVPEDRKSLGLNLIRSVEDNITIAALDKVLSGGVIDFNKSKKAAERFRSSLNIKTPNVDFIVSALSGGNQQKVVLGKWMFTAPDLLILDEPTRGIDVGAKYEIYEIIQDLARSGKAILFISSELPEILGICDRVYTMSQGRITGEVDVNDANQESLMRLMTKEKVDV